MCRLIAHRCPELEGLECLNRGSGQHLQLLWLNSPSGQRCKRVQVVKCGQVDPPNSQSPKTDGFLCQFFA